MTLPASGNPISFSQLRTEFGATSGSSVSLGSYRINESYGTLTDLPLDTGVPKPGEIISASNLYGKKLNVIIDCYSGGAVTRVDARAKYDAGEVNIVGGFKIAAQLPSEGAGSRIITYVNKQIGSAKGSRNYAALKTGQWGSGATMEIIIGSSGGIYGAGGDGGLGGDGSGSNGGQGTTALGIQYPVSINNQGTIFAGRGGGGGGAGGIGYKHADTQRGCQGRQDCVYVAGGGGAGGRGFPAGNGGAPGNNPGSCRGVQVNAGAGGNGNVNNNGAGGDGGYAGEAGGCNGPAVSGAGGGAESSGGGGNNASGNGNPWSVGSGGNRGYAVIIDSTGSLISYVGNVADGGTFTSAQVGASA
jgi:hypothetical protein